MPRAPVTSGGRGDSGHPPALLPCLVPCHCLLSFSPPSTSVPHSAPLPPPPPLPSLLPPPLSLTLLPSLLHHHCLLSSLLLCP
ncbi:hypothetical protein Pmani_039413 [Petrolisthes manimaculis]|uniref:Uncharacterized protein n=1 Tax=Petrolisthes manimaculis TaxID=1843537 RepID=A0AAE1NDU5_9EUCA|nr:hypothetical protein Pmani_039413 [Petrolisthes manimaculis]